MTPDIAKGLKIDSDNILELCKDIQADADKLTNKEIQTLATETIERFEELEEDISGIIQNLPGHEDNELCRCLSFIKLLGHLEGIWALFPTAFEYRNEEEAKDPKSNDFIFMKQYLHVIYKHVLPELCRKYGILLAEASHESLCDNEDEDMQSTVTHEEAWS